MRPLLSLAVLIAFAATVFAEEKPTKMLIAEAVLPLPEPLRARATVVSYDASGVRSILRQGTNDLICDVDGPSEGYFVMCYHDSLAPHFQQRKKWAADGKGGAEIDRLLLEAMEDGSLPIPQAGAVNYVLQGPVVSGATPLFVMHLPGGTAESTGLSTDLDHYRPWLMGAGTAWAHVMIPGK